MRGYRDQTLQTHLQQIHIEGPAGQEADQQTEEQAAAHAKQRRTFYAFPEDDQAVAAIRAKYGCSTDSDAVRLALRLLAGDAIKVTTVPATVRRITVKFKARPTG